MVQIVLLVIFLLMAFYLILLIRSFEFMSIRELKRQARSGNPEAKKVYAVRAYGMQLWIILWMAMGFITSAVVLLLHSLLGTALTLIISIPLIVLLHAVLPWTKRPIPSLKLAAQACPILEMKLKFLFPVLSKLERFFGKWIQPEPIRFIHSKEELLEILKYNASEYEHLDKQELKIAQNALVFGDKNVGDYMIPLSGVYFISQEEHLTPIIMDELHKSGFSRVPVFSGNHQHIVGTLYIKDAISLSGQRLVKDIMRKEVYYINEHHSLLHALKAFIKTKHHLFMVVNAFEEVVGVISLEDVLEQILGVQVVDEFDQFDDLRAVALSSAQKVKQERAVETVQS